MGIKQQLTKLIKLNELKVARNLHACVGATDQHGRIIHAQGKFCNILIL
jgi:hypothetical protein